MFNWLKKQLVAWVENHQRAEIARLRAESKRLSEEYDLIAAGTML